MMVLLASSPAGYMWWNWSQMRSSPERMKVCLRSIDAATQLVLQRDAWLGMRQQSGTRAGTHQRHTRTINVSPTTQANCAARAINGKRPTRPLYMHLTRTPHTGRTMPIGPISLNHESTHTSHRTLTCALRSGWLGL